MIDELKPKLSVEPLAEHSGTQTVLVRLSESELQALSHTAHDHQRCGGYELLTDIPAEAKKGNPRHLAQARKISNEIFAMFDQQAKRDTEYASKARATVETLGKNPLIEAAIAEVSETNLRETVDFLSRYPSRNHKSRDGQDAVTAFRQKIESTLKDAKLPYKLEFVQHQSTPMNSIKLTLSGQGALSNEVVVLGGHIDSINSSFFGGGSKKAPGADDNASGSANILEAARILLSQTQAPSRSYEFYWYAGEEGGLLGSAEIAKAAKAGGKKIVGVLQLDMTLFPGDGEFSLGSMTDFTSLEMRDLLERINRDYIGATIIEDKCGYGCSDHASWYRNGFPTLMPFEATMRKMNKAIHTERDVVSTSLSFRHSAMFTKIAVAFMMTLGNP
ncbi:MAG: M20/M25/M40 family metallo-hydrolase [Bdellovibrionales bacterium]|nr:M20/M25/M40 family metallo-hydrolase [Bdellovibrionales bacterium]